MTITKFLIIVVGGILTLITLLIWVLFALSTIGLVITLVAAPPGTITTNDLAFYLLLMVFRKPMEAITTTFLDENNIPQRGRQKEPEQSIRQTINIQL